MLKTYEQDETKIDYLQVTLHSFVFLSRAFEKLQFYPREGKKEKKTLLNQISPRFTK